MFTWERMSYRPSASAKDISVFMLIKNNFLVLFLLKDSETTFYNIIGAKNYTFKKPKLMR